MSNNSASNVRPQVLVTGANGFFGLWLVPELLNQGYRVIAAMRNPEQRRQWFYNSIATRIEPRDGWQQDLQLVAFSLGDTDGLSAQLPRARQEIHAVYHLAGAYGWRLDPDHAHEVNVTAAESLLSWVGSFQQLQRFIWIGGYRIAFDDNVPEAELYKKLGGYEASKFIAHRKIIEKANSLAIPWTALNPATVIGDSRSGETTQFIGVAELVEQLFHGKLTAIPGSKRTFVPLVHVDYLAEFAVAVLKHPESVGRQYWLLDSETPALPELISGFADHMGMQPPKLQIPVSVLKRLPGFMLPGSRETLSFLTEDRYPTEPAQALAAKMQLRSPLKIRDTSAWVDYMVRNDFDRGATDKGRNPAHTGQSRFVNDLWEQEVRSSDGAGTQANHQLVLLHGLPLNGDSWQPVLDALPESARYRALIPDLPGLGRSGGKPVAVAADGSLDIGFLKERLAADDHDKKITLIGHSLGAGLALEFARQYPDKVRQLVLVSPYFLQGKPALFLRNRWLGGLLSVLMSPAKLALSLHPEGERQPAVASALASLQRPRVRRHLFRYLAGVATDTHRRHMQQALAELQVPVVLVAGETDPLILSPEDLPKVSPQVIPGAGHNPQLTHPQAVAAVIQQAIAAGPADASETLRAVKDYSAVNAC